MPGLVQQAAYLEFQLVVDGQAAIGQIRAVDAALAGREIHAARGRRCGFASVDSADAPPTAR